jgi:hypothetical protein
VFVSENYLETVSERRLSTFLRYYLADKDDVVTVYPVKEFKFLITETFQAELPTSTAQYIFISFLWK